MALIKTITEVKAIHPRLLSSTSKDALLPNFEAAEYKYLVPLIGLPLYNDITGKYTSNPVTLADLSTIEKALLKKIQAMLVAATYMDECGRELAKFTDTGLMSMVTGEQRLFGWNYKEAKQGLTELYYDGMEVLLTWLYDNKASFALWTANDAYKKYNDLLVKNGTDFNDQYRLYQPMRNYWMLRGIIQDVQDNYHSITFGKTLLTYFVNLTTPTDAEKEILRALKKAMAFFTVYRACRMHSVRFSDAGFTIVSSESEAQSSVQGAAPVPYFDHHMRAAEQDGYQQLTRAKTLCVAMREGSVTAFNTAYDDSPLVGYTVPDIAERNNALTGGVRLGI